MVERERESERERGEKKEKWENERKRERKKKAKGKRKDAADFLCVRMLTMYVSTTMSSTDPDINFHRRV